MALKVIQYAPDQNPRKCGDCTLCCKILTIKKYENGPLSATQDFPFDKPANIWCKHCKPGSCCTIFSTPELPNLCKNYRCAWLNGELPESLKPNRVHAVIDIRSDTMLITQDKAYMVHPDVQKLIGANVGKTRMLIVGPFGIEVSGLGATQEKCQADAQTVLDDINTVGISMGN